MKLSSTPAKSLKTLHAFLYTENTATFVRWSQNCCSRCLQIYLYIYYTPTCQPIFMPRQSFTHASPKHKKIMVKIYWASRSYNIFQQLLRIPTRKWRKNETIIPWQCDPDSRWRSLPLSSVPSRRDPWHNLNVLLDGQAGSLEREKGSHGLPQPWVRGRRAQCCIKSCDDS